MKDRFLRRGGFIRLNGRTAGFDNFEKVAIQSGIVETLFQLARNTDKTMDRVFTAYFAAESLWKPIVIGTVKEKEELLNKYMEHHAVDFCLEVRIVVCQGGPERHKAKTVEQAARNATFIAHRVIGMIGLRVLSQECFLADHLDLEKTSEVIKTCCDGMLLGPDLWVKQLRDPASTWQSLFCFGNIQVRAIFRETDSGQHNLSPVVTGAT